MISQISQKYGTSSYSDVVVGIELLNEPLISALPGGKSATQGYYQSGFNTVRQSGQTPVIIHDGFLNPSAWDGFLTGSGTSGAIVDHHEYQVFSDDLLALTPEEHVSYVWSSADTWASGQDKYLICGEWSAAMTDCAPYLNGYGTGARYDGTYSGSSYVGSCSQIDNIGSWSEYNKTTTTNYISAQIQAFESKAQGWIFWNFKTENAPEWDLFQLLDNGVWPSSSGY